MTNPATKSPILPIPLCFIRKIIKLVFFYKNTNLIIQTKNTNLIKKNTKNNSMDERGMPLPEVSRIHTQNAKYPHAELTGHRWI